LNCWYFSTLWLHTATVKPMAVVIQIEANPGIFGICAAKRWLGYMSRLPLQALPIGLERFPMSQSKPAAALLEIWHGAFMLMTVTTGLDLSSPFLYFT
jgi:hypothetical protein